jgi:hypothetical protein
MASEHTADTRYASDAAGTFISGQCVDCGSQYACRRPSRFQIDRDPYDDTYPTCEACEEHLPGAIADLLDGDAGVTGKVTVHWDGEELPACNDSSPLQGDRCPCTQSGSGGDHG